MEQYCIVGHGEIPQAIAINIWSMMIWLNPKIGHATSMQRMRFVLQLGPHALKNPVKKMISYINELVRSEHVIVKFVRILVLNTYVLEMQ